MRAVVQRVKSASVQVDGRVASHIGSGLVCLIGIRDTDNESDADFICKKILKSKVFQNKESGKSWDETVVSRDYEVLLVSQFTLHARLKKPKPDFSKAMSTSEAKKFYESFVQRVKDNYVDDRVKDGVFGAMMDVSLINDGPVTFVIDSEVPE